MSPRETCKCGLENPGPEHWAYYPMLCAEYPPALAESDGGRSATDLPYALTSESNCFGYHGSRNAGKQGFGDRLIAVFYRAADSPRCQFEFLNKHSLRRLIHVKRILSDVSNRLHCEGADPGGR